MQVNGEMEMIEMGGIILQKEIRTDTLELSRALIEIKYQGAFKLPERKYQILERLADVFPDYNLDQPDTIMLQDKKVPPSSAFISINRLGYESNGKQWPEFKKNTLRIIKDVSEILNLKTCTRIGIRTFWQKNFATRDEAVNYFQHNFMSNLAKHTGILGPTLLNGMITLNIKGEPGINLTIVPQSHHSIKLSNLEQEINTKESLLIDCDVFWENDVLTLQEMKKTLDEVHRIIVNNVFNFLNLIIEDANK